MTLETESNYNVTTSSSKQSKHSAQNKDSPTQRLLPKVIIAKPHKSFRIGDSYLRETLIYLSDSIPIILSLLTEFIPQVIVSSVIGHLDDAPKKLSAAGMARGFSNVFGLAIAWGLTEIIQKFTCALIILMYN